MQSHTSKYAVCTQGFKYGLSRAFHIGSSDSSLTFNIYLYELKYYTERTFIIANISTTIEFLTLHLNNLMNHTYVTLFLLHLLQSNLMFKIDVKCILSFRLSC